VIVDLLRANEKFPHRQHQLVGVEALLEHPFFLLADEVGAGKSKQVVDASQILWLHNEIDTALVITPGFARSTWAEEDPLLGEVAKHIWDQVPNTIHEFSSHAKFTGWDKGLNWLVTNYELVRREERLASLLDILRGRNTLLVLDESWALKGNSDQMRACRTLRYKRAKRVVELNGTPLSDGKPSDLYYPMMILDTEILGVKNKTHFKAKYCVMGGYMNKQVIDYKNLDELNQRIAPYVLTRRTRDCFDLPPMLPPVMVEARLTPATWATYKEMRDEMVSVLGNLTSVSRQAVVRGLRLSQITSGYLGGLEETNMDDVIDEGLNLDNLTNELPDWLRRINEDTKVRGQAQASGNSTPEQSGIGGTPEQVRSRSLTLTREIGREKLDAFLVWLGTLTPRPTKLLVWCRFRAELERATAALEQLYPAVFQLKGGQTKDDRRAAKEALAPGSAITCAAVVGNQKAGGASLNFSGANVAVYLSNGPALIERTQSIGRIERPGATQPMLIVDVVATGPKGQKTIDHAVLKALREKQDMSAWTVDEWRKIIASL
jgi:hypothetical protein